MNSEFLTQLYKILNEAIEAIDALTEIFKLNNSIWQRINTHEYEPKKTQELLDKVLVLGKEFVRANGNPTPEINALWWGAVNADKAGKVREAAGYINDWLVAQNEHRKFSVDWENQRVLRGKVPMEPVPKEA